MSNKPLRYSPHPPEAYTRPCPDLGNVGIGREMVGVDRLPQWNLYWLSDAAVDDFLTDYATWMEGSRSIDMKMLAACVKATKQKLGGDLVENLLRSLSPAEFVARVKANPHKHLAPYKLGGVAWLQLIESRSKQFRGTLGTSGNVSRANFGRAPVNAENKAWMPRTPIDELVKELADLGGSRRNGADFWKKLCRYMHQEGIKRAEALTRFSGVFEREYKSRQGESIMPGAYKSAKSILKKALVCKVPYMDQNGNPRRKADVFNACK